MILNWARDYSTLQLISVLHSILWFQVHWFVFTHTKLRHAYLHPSTLPLWFVTTCIFLSIKKGVLQIHFTLSLCAMITWDILILGNLWCLSWYKLLIVQTNYLLYSIWYLHSQKTRYSYCTPKGTKGFSPGQDPQKYLFVPLT